MPLLNRKALLFTALAYGLAWVPSLTYFARGGTVTSPWFLAVATGVMFTPALAAVIVQKGVYGASLAEIGLRFTINRRFLIAALLPIGLVLGALFLSALWPGVRLSSGLEVLQSQLYLQMPRAEADEALRPLENLGPLLPVLLIGGGALAALLLGSTINAIPALGEELGWRGLLQHTWRPLGFWRSSALVGVVWGLWHAPLIWHGYNYPGYPMLGIVMMTLLAVLLSPLFLFAQERAGTVLAAAVMHGVFNAYAALPNLLLVGGTRVTVGMLGAAGLLALLLANGLLFFWRRRRKQAPVSESPSQTAQLARESS